MPWGILLMLLGQLLKWLLSLLEKNRKPSKYDLARLDKVTWYLNQIHPKAMAVGGSYYGTPPDGQDSYYADAPPAQLKKLAVMEKALAKKGK